jgi:hypothetical protein
MQGPRVRSKVIGTERRTGGAGLTYSTHGTIEQGEPAATGQL